MSDRTALAASSALLALYYPLVAAVCLEQGLTLEIS